MTLSALALPFESHVPAHDERLAANQLRTYIARSISSTTGEATLRISDETGESNQICLPADMSQTLMNLLRMISKGEAVTLVPLTQMLTTQRAADMLNVSRPYLIKLLDRGEIPHERVGRHRRIKAQDLFTYVEQRKKIRETALKELADLNEEID